MSFNCIEEKRFKYKGFACVVLFHEMGYRTAYVGIPKGHPLYNIPYNQINIVCHGGLTYSSNELYYQNDENIWWIGFDCFHWGDGVDINGVVKYFNKMPNFVMHQKPKSLEFCIDELKMIVNKIINSCKV